MDIESFLAQAIRQRKLEQNLTRYSLKQLRDALSWVYARIDFYGLNDVVPNRAGLISQLRADVENYMTAEFATPLMRTMQSSEIMQDFVSSQMGLARSAVTATGGTVTGATTAAQLSTQALAAVTVNGIPWEEFVSVRLPRSVADKVARFVNLGLLDPEAKTVAAFDNAVLRTTKTSVEALITTGVHDTGNIAQQLLWNLEADPAWKEDNQQVWSALLDSVVCATCMGLDGKRFPMDYEKVSPHPQCRCVLLPESFFTEVRPAEGDGGELSDIQPTKKATEAWLRKNPQTAASILGKRRSQRFVDGKISLDRAIKEAGGI